MASAKLISYFNQLVQREMLKFSCTAKTLTKSLSNFLIRWNNLESSKERMIINDIIRDRNKIMREVIMKI